MKSWLATLVLRFKKPPAFQAEEGQVPDVAESAKSASEETPQQGRLT